MWIIWLSYFFLSILFLDFHFLPIIQPLLMFSCWCHQTQTLKPPMDPFCPSMHFNQASSETTAAWCRTLTHTYRTTKHHSAQKYNTTGVSTFISMNKVWLQLGDNKVLCFLLICTPQVTDRSVCGFSRYNYSSENKTMVIICLIIITTVFINKVLFEGKKDQQKQSSSNNHKNQEKHN